MKDMTKKSLGEAFAGESMAHMKYLAFAEAARKEGLAGVAKLFEATAYAEMVHAHNHARNLDYIGSTSENLQAGIEGEGFEVDEMYPAYNAIAELQGEKGAMKAIHYALEAEKIHKAYYTEAKAAVDSGKDADVESVYICPVCGYTHVNDGGLPDKCPVCGVAQDKFKKF